VQDGVHDAFVERLAARVAALHVGPATESAAQIGPMINARAVDKIDRHVRDAVDKGARVVTGGERVRTGDGPHYYAPTVLVDATPAMALAHEETFGPVAPVFRFRHEDEVVRHANDTPFGLAAYFYSNDVRRIWRVAQALETGIVGINEGALASRPPRSAVSRNPATGARARATGLTITCIPSISARANALKSV
jgi:succinate-semialdehyde dehydrogenase/glutarate-semialdehyde dehydrogenase